MSGSDRDRLGADERGAGGGAHHEDEDRDQHSDSDDRPPMAAQPVTGEGESASEALKRFFNEDVRGTR